MIAEIKFACPHCGQRIAVGSDAAGVAIECPTCQNGVTIPNGSDPAEVEINDGDVRERLEASRAENERLRSNATLAQAEIKSFNNERLALRNEAASHKQRAAVAESRLAAMQGELDLLRQRLNATETQLGSAEAELAESRAAGARQAGERSAVEQEIAGVRSELAAARAALEEMQIAAAMAEARVIETEKQVAEAREKLEGAVVKTHTLQEQCAASRKEADALRGLVNTDEASREFLSTKTKLSSAEEELAARRQSTAQLEADLLAAETERRRLEEERGALHRRVAEALKQVEELSKDEVNADNEKLRELLDRQNAELKSLFRELARFRRAKLTLKIIWALAGIGFVGLGYVFMKILPQIEWSR